jgi:dolichol-phosphate mannosyltransferase
MTSPAVSVRNFLRSAEPSHCQPVDKAAKAQPLNRSLVVVPTYNEVANVPILIDRLMALPRVVDILIVDDKSPDGTARKIRQHQDFRRRVFLLENDRRHGFAQACKDGFCWAVENGYDACVEMDADLSHDPASVPELLEMIERGADLAVGSRYLNGIRIINWPVARLLLSLFAGRYTRFLSGLPMTDPTSGFKAIRTNVLRSIDWSRFNADGYGFIIEFHFLVWQSGFAIRECPIVFTERRRGASKMSKKIMMESAISVLRLACRRTRRSAHLTLEPATSV